MTTSLAALLFSAVLSSQPSSLAQCDADPTGARDSTPAFANCLNALPAGDLAVPNGIYKISGKIFITRNQSLIGNGPKASILKCQSTNAPCVVAADASNGPNNYSMSRIENIGIEGPGQNNTSIGIYLGGDPAGAFSPRNAFADFVNLVNVRITGFNHGAQWGNNAYANKIVRSSIVGNSTGLYVPSETRNSGEAIGISDSNIFNNRLFGLEDHGRFEWMIQGSSFDYNGTAIEFYGAKIHVINCHFEQNGGQVFFQPFGAASLSIRDSEILVQAPAGEDKYIVNTWPQSLNVVIDDVSIWSNHLVHFFIHTQGAITGTVTNLHGNGNKKIEAFSDSPASARITSGQAFSPDSVR